MMAKKAKKSKKATKQRVTNPRKRGTQNHAGNKESLVRRVVLKQVSTVSPTARSSQYDGRTSIQTGVRLDVSDIDRDTVLGDLIVAFPWTREVLKKYGLQLEVEEAGDIYMSVEAFAALRNLKPESLIHELVDASKQPPQSPPSVPLVAAPTT